MTATTDFLANDGSPFGQLIQPGTFTDGERTGQRDRAEAAEEHQQDNDDLAGGRQVGRDAGGQPHCAERRCGFEQQLVQRMGGQLDQGQSGHNDAYDAEQSDRERLPLNSGADVAFVTTSPGAFGSIFGQALAAGYQGIWSGANPSFNPALVGPDSQIAEPLAASSYWSAYTSVWTSDTPGVTEAKELVGDRLPQPTSAVFEGFVEASIMHAALQAAYDAGDLTQAGVLSAAVGGCPSVPPFPDTSPMSLRGACRAAPSPRAWIPGHESDRSPTIADPLERLLGIGVTVSVRPGQTIVLEGDHLTTRGEIAADTLSRFRLSDGPMALWRGVIRHLDGRPVRDLSWLEDAQLAEPCLHPVPRRQHRAHGHRFFLEQRLAFRKLQHVRDIADSLHAFGHALPAGRSRRRRPSTDCRKPAG